METTKKKTLEMIRSGEFEIRTRGDNHCGTADRLKIRYHMKCKCSSKLDRRGFLFDQLNVQQFFDSIGRTKLSCEQLTIKCVEQLMAQILVENPSCQIYRMELTLAPEPFMASMTHVWEDARPFKANKRLQDVVRTVRRAAETPLYKFHEGR